VPKRSTRKLAHNDDVDSPAAIAIAIRDLRRELGLTQVQFAAELGITPTTVYRYEAGTGVPTNDTLVKILQYAVTKQVPRTVQTLTDAISQRTGLNLADAEPLTSETPFVAAIANLRLEKRSLVIALVAMLSAGDNETEVRVLEALLKPWMPRTVGSSSEPPHTKTQ
jgi:transcriptional regulator with XRE-family HTH domain